MPFLILIVVVLLLFLLAIGLLFYGLMALFYGIMNENQQLKSRLWLMEKHQKETQFENKKYRLIINHLQDELNDLKKEKDSISLL